MSQTPARRLTRLPALAALMLVPVAAHALTEGNASASDPRLVFNAPYMVKHVPVLPGEATNAGTAAQGFLVRRGGQWSFSADAATGRALLVSGSGVPMIPGRGNALDFTTLDGLPLPDGEITLETLEPLARAFIAENAGLLSPSAGELVLDRATSLSREDGRLWTLHFDWTVDGVPVEGAAVFLRLNSGNLTQFGAPLIGNVNVNTTPSFGGGEAVQRLLDWAGEDETARLTEPARLVIQSEEDGAGGIARRLVWVVTYRNPDRIETWEGRLDAQTGDVVSFRDTNAYGRMRGGVYPRTVVDQEVSVPLPLTEVSGASSTDEAGFFFYSGGKISSSMNGDFFNTNCSDGCSNPPQALVSTDVGLGWLDFGLGGVDEAGNGVSSKADRNAFYHLNQVRRVAKKWLPTLGWLDTNITANVNILNTCNASWGGSANFYRSGGGCNNTGEIADVMQHEWGHGVDGNTRSGDGATGEGTADIVAMQMTHSPLIGPYFRTNGNPVRNVDQFTTSKGLLTRTNIGSKCPGGPGPLGHSVHCEGEIIGQTTWDLSQALVAKHGHHTGWRTMERIFFTSLPDQGGYLPTQSFPFYDAYLNADDDDGNLANGTPNGQEIFDAFSTHEIEGTVTSSSPGCTRPAQPVVNATPGCDDVSVSWNAVTGASQYEVLRAELNLDSAFYPVSTVGAGTTNIVDANVAPGLDYWYVGMAVDGTGCESTVENPVLARLPSRPILNVTVATPDDVPAGNRSGFPDPDEDVDVVVTLANVGDDTATGITGTLIADTPGVSILDGSETWPSIAAGGSASQDASLRFTTDGLQVACGDALQFRLQPSSASACSTDDSYIQVVLGDRSILNAYDFETSSGWTLDAVNSTATSGNWVRGDPDPTSYQPGDDVTADPGVNAWFTASNGGGLGADDVDDGVTILLSPVFDLTGATDSLLTFWRWFGNRDLGEDAGDFFAADISDNAGASWVNLETLGTNDSAAAWTKKEFKIEDFVTLTSQMQIRFQAADGTATGNIIEAAIDEVRVEQPVCDSTPACFIPPTFNGLDAADPGSSCAETDLSWTAAASNCTNAVITYNVYRSIDPGFTPDAGNLLVSNLAGTSFTDTLLTPGQSYTYIVRAYDSRSGEEANLLRYTVTAPTAPDIRAPVFDGAAPAAAGDSCGETVLGWSAAQETCSGPVSYEVYRSTNPAFNPTPADRIATTFDLAFNDVAATPGTDYTYVVRARDDTGNEDTNLVRVTIRATILDSILVFEDFESSNGGWQTIVPNDAASGLWEWGDPEGTEYQSEDDYTESPGVNAWVTGVAANGGGGGNDVDDGTTTMISALYDLTGAVDPEVRYARWFTNDRGQAPGEDPLTVDISNDDGANFVQLEQVSGGTPLDWVFTQVPLAGVIAPTSQMRIRFQTQDSPQSGSLVEGAIDNFTIVDREQGCLGCPTPVPIVGNTVLASLSGSDVVLDWSGDPSAESSFGVYTLSGPTFSDAVLVGSSAAKSFTHASAAGASTAFFYRVTAVDACANESALQ